LEKEEIDRINRYISGMTNEEETKLAEELFLDGENNEILRDTLKKEWYAMNATPEVGNIDLTHLLDRIYHTIGRNETMKKQRPLSRIISFYMRAAAILLLPLLIAGGIYLFIPGKQNKSIAAEAVTATIYAPLGSRVSFNLPDGTAGMLNSGSNITYNVPFDERNIRIEGEAWFKVACDEEHPFRISAGNSFVRVLGTTFNISAYRDEDYVEVVLEEGSLEFSDPKGTVIIKPAERLVYQEGKPVKSVVDPSKYNAWTEGKLVFRGDPMDEVVRRIERWYNVKISIADRELERYSFRATFQDDTLEDVLRFLSMTSPIDYRVIPRKALPDGTYSKEEVTLYKRVL